MNDSDLTRTSGGSFPRDEPRVAIIILNWNRPKDTMACLDSVRSLLYANFQVVVIDNGSTDDSVSQIRDWMLKPIPGSSPRKGKTTATFSMDQGHQTIVLESFSPERQWHLIESGDNLGFAEGNNVAIRWILNSPCPPEFIFLLNNDAVAEPESLQEAVRVAMRNKASVVGFAVIDKVGNHFQYSGDRRRPELFYLRPRGKDRSGQSEAPTNNVMGCAMLIRSGALMEHLERYSYVFDPRLFLYGEETEFCLHLLKMGHSIYIARNAVVRHEGAKSLRSEIKDASQLYYTSRNTVMIARHLLSGLWLSLFHVYYLAGRLKVFFLKTFSGKHRESLALAKGVIDGYRGKGGPWKA